MGDLIAFYLGQCFRFLNITSPWFGMSFFEILIGASTVAIGIWAIRLYFHGLGAPDTHLGEKIADDIGRKRGL